MNIMNCVDRRSSRATASLRPPTSRARHISFETVLDRFCSSDVAPSGGPVFHSHECRRKAEEADELAQKATDPAIRLVYEEIARRWREMAERAERNKW